MTKIVDTDTLINFGVAHISISLFGDEVANITVANGEASIKIIEEEGHLNDPRIIKAAIQAALNAGAKKLLCDDNDEALAMIGRSYMTVVIQEYQEYDTSETYQYYN